VKRFFVLAFVCFPVMALVSQVCGQIKEGQKPSMEKALTTAEAKKSDLVLTAKVPADSLCGLAIPLTGVLKNQGNDKVQVFTGAGEKLKVKVVNASGKQIPLTLYGQQFYPKGPTVGSAGVKVLSPTESLKEELDLQRIFDLTIAGTYTLSVSRNVILPSGERVVLEIGKLSFKVSDPTPAP